MRHKIGGMQRKILCAMLALVLLFGLGACQEKPAPTPATDFRLETLAGGMVALSDFKNEAPMVVTFWASWCSDCHQQLPIIYKLTQDFSDKNVEFLMVNSTSGERETEAAAIKYLKENEFDFEHVLMDYEGDAAGKYEVWFIPTTLFINSAGEIVERCDEVLSEAQMRRKIEDLLK